MLYPYTFCGPVPWCGCYRALNLSVAWFWLFHQFVFRRKSMLTAYSVPKSEIIGIKFSIKLLDRNDDFSRNVRNEFFHFEIITDIDAFIKPSCCWNWLATLTCYKYHLEWDPQGIQPLYLGLHLPAEGIWLGDGHPTSLRTVLVFLAVLMISPSSFPGSRMDWNSKMEELMQLFWHFDLPIFKNTFVFPFIQMF